MPSPSSTEQTRSRSPAIALCAGLVIVGSLGLVPSTLLSLKMGTAMRAFDQQLEQAPKNQETARLRALSQRDAHMVWKQQLSGFMSLAGVFFGLGAGLLIALRRSPGVATAMVVLALVGASGGYLGLTVPPVSWMSPLLLRTLLVMIALGLVGAQLTRTEAGDRKLTPRMRAAIGLASYFALERLVWYGLSSYASELRPHQAFRYAAQVVGRVRLPDHIAAGLALLLLLGVVLVVLKRNRGLRMTLWCALLLAMGSATADIFSHTSYLRSHWQYGWGQVTQNEFLVGAVLAALMGGVVAWLLRVERFTESWEREDDGDAAGPAFDAEEGVP